MIGQTISHYHGGSRVRPLPDKILEKPRKQDGGQVGEARLTNSQRTYNG